MTSRRTLTVAAFVDLCPNDIRKKVGVAVKPKIFAYVVSAWLLLIVVNLLLIPGYYDVALRDFGLALGALALARLSHEFGR